MWKNVPRTEGEYPTGLQDGFLILVLTFLSPILSQTDDDLKTALTGIKTIIGEGRGMDLGQILRLKRKENTMLGDEECLLTLS